jgi:hypothetical protein
MRSAFKHRRQPLLEESVAAAYAEAVQALDPMVYWRFGEGSGTTVIDSSPAALFGGAYVNHTPALGVPGLYDTDDDTAWNVLGGATNRLAQSTASIPSTVFSTGCTLAAMVRVNVTSPMSIRVCGFRPANGRGVSLQISSSPLRVFINYTGAGPGFIGYSHGSNNLFTPAGTIRRVWGVYEPDGTTSIYNDGALFGQVVNGEAPTVPQSTQFWAGVSSTGTTVDVTIDEVVFLDYPLTAQEIADVDALAVAS